MRTALATFQLLVGLGGAGAVFIMLISMGSIATFTWSIKGILYWAALFAGPILLVAGSLLVLCEARPRLGSLLTIAGSIALTAWAVHLAVALPGDQSRRGVDAGLLLLVSVIWLLVLAVDFAAYRVYRLIEH